MRLVLAILLVACAGSPARRAHAEVIINLTDLGSGTAPGSMSGTGSLSSVMTAAAQVWELAYNDTSYSHTLEIAYDWVDLGSGVLGSHSLTAAGGVPYRETAGTLSFGSSVSWFADGSLSGSDPLNSGNTEFQFFTESSQDFGGGVMNTGRVFTGATGDAAGVYDLFSIALHEIGHALGMSALNLEYQSETSGDSDIDVSFAGLPFAGSQLPTFGAHAHLTVNSALLYTSFSTGQRKLPSAMDIVANAQISQFAAPNYNLDAASVPEPATYAMTMFALTLLCGRYGYGRRAPVRRDESARAETLSAVPASTFPNE